LDSWTWNNNTRTPEQHNTNSLLSLLELFSTIHQKSTMSRRSRSQKKDIAPEKADLDRFAGSSDEEEQDQDSKEDEYDGADDEGREEDAVASSEGEPEKDENIKKEDIAEDSDAGSEDDIGAYIDSDIGGSAKMANAMARILGSTTDSSNSVVLAKTNTPLQRMAQKEKEQMKALKEKRQANRERNLTALHIPLSVATTNTIEDGQLSVTQELEQERLHRRVATRGVVALFNAISQHQKTTEVSFSVLIACAFHARMLVSLFFCGDYRTLLQRRNERMPLNSPNTDSWIR
jgi:hypothetical protein